MGAPRPFYPPGSGKMLSTNYAPTLTERSMIATMVESMEQELTSLEEVILPLTARRDKLKEDILAHKALLAPARRLLPELVSEVFAHTFPDMQTLWTHQRGTQRAIRPQSFPRPCVDDMPLKLGRICRQWRHIALTTPSLWSKIRIPMNWIVERLQEWIMRAGSCPLSFAVAVSRPNSDILKTLASYQRRWSDVVLQCDNADSQFIQGFLESLSPNYPILHALELRRTSRNRTPGTPSQSPSVFQLVVESAPNLRCLISSVTLVQLATPDNLPSLRLREIVMLTEVISTSELLSLLRLCPAIQSVKAAVLHKFDRSEPHRDVLNLAALKHVTISGYYLEDQNFCILGRLSLPAMEELSLNIEIDSNAPIPTTQPAYTPQFRSLIFRSHPPLKFLHVQGHFYVSTIEIEECLTVLPLLSYLKLEDMHGEFDVIANVLTLPAPFSDDDLSRYICPRLKEMFLGDHNEPWRYLPPELIIKMILSRNFSRESRLSRVTALECNESEVLADPFIDRSN